ncbi:MAG: SDR family oxidoreductase [Pseudomonadota bacterium]
MQLAIVGATGKTGLLLCEQALAKGHAVTAYVRDPAKLGTLGDRLSVVEGTLEDAEALSSAVRGADAVISALGTVDRKPNTVLSDATRRIVRAMEEEGVARLAAITSLGCGASRDQVNSRLMRFLIKTVAKEIWADKDRQEDVIRASELDYLIVRPGGLTDRPARGSWTIMREGEAQKGRQMIARADVAAFILQKLESGELGREAVVIF